MSMQKQVTQHSPILIQFKPSVRNKLHTLTQVSFLWHERKTQFHVCHYHCPSPMGNLHRPLKDSTPFNIQQRKPSLIQLDIIPSSPQCMALHFIQSLLFSTHLSIPYMCPYPISYLMADQHNITPQKNASPISIRYIHPLIPTSTIYVSVQGGK